MIATCDTCDERLFAVGRSVSVLDASGEHLDVYVRDLTKIDPELAAELNLADGMLTYHTGCGHPIREYLFTDGELEDVLTADQLHPS